MTCIPFCLSVKFVNEKPSSKTDLKSLKDKAFNTMNQFLLLKHNFCETWLNVHQFCWLTMWRLSHKAKFCIIKPKKTWFPSPTGICQEYFLCGTSTSISSSTRCTSTSSTGITSTTWNALYYMRFLHVYAGIECLWWWIQGYYMKRITLHELLKYMLSKAFVG